MGPHLQPDSAYRYRAKLFLENGGELQVWRTRLISTLEANTRPMPPGEQTAVRLVDKLGAADPHEDCPGKSSHNWVRGTFLVLPDLSGPDPRIDHGTAMLLHSHWPVLYWGRTLLINSYSVFTAEPLGICSFRQ